MVWATARREPTKAYFELEAQPEQRIGYTASDESAKIYKVLRLIETREKGIGAGAHISRASIRAIAGPVKNVRGEELLGRISSFRNSLIPSAKG